ncbi:hypothetical protein P168DRAFT_130757 [Aspergillus campestris IBT 28561]|uniref:Uncharacterized protein n=1 Tax=Aspergillus campestris (strain IBT 28561) TaxID=1392248 RepID=A0A2I1D7E9_ASPC2|nr:uncharacterized protein P168DRAFT_130757 [Aspergillus campestris IBT 28561]PKY05794.1 hypothetical protein P168DRAFT_130757 [Aspergillus campestris IBT 28561]
MHLGFCKLQDAFLPSFPEAHSRAFRLLLPSSAYPSLFSRALIRIGSFSRLNDIPSCQLIRGDCSRRHITSPAYYTIVLELVSTTPSRDHILHMCQSFTCPLVLLIDAPSSSQLTHKWLNRDLIRCPLSYRLESAWHVTDVLSCDIPAVSLGLFGRRRNSWPDADRPTPLLLPMSVNRRYR